MDLLQGESDSDIEFSINEKYAKKYDKWRRGEEMQKIKDKYGNIEDSDSSTSEEEDEDGKELTEDVEKQFFKTLSCLKEKNPKIYDQNVTFFEKKNEDSEEVENHVEKKKKEPSLTVAGYQRKVLLETGGQFSDTEEEQKQPFEMMNDEDQENAIKQSFKDVLKDSDSEDNEGSWGNLFMKRIKTVEEINKEEEDYKKWLAGEEKLKNLQMKEELKGLHDYWSNPELDDGEKFLRDYILNRRYLDKDDKNRIPSYDEVVHDSDSSLSADEAMIKRQDEFEKKYNFRFEEPDQEFIKRYPRTLEQSMRKKDERRKKHREEIKQRKEAERSKKDEELKRLKTFKKKEIMDKIKKLQQITGNGDIAFQEEDLEEDFDPEKHDKRMSQIFNENYYNTGNIDIVKPEFPEFDEEFEIENWDEWDASNEQTEELHCEDPGFNMDCDYDPTKKKELQKELIENSRSRKKRRKSRFAEAVAKKKPVFDPKDKTFEQYIDEYYALDYEDLIGDIPCRFKYRKVVPNDFGLSIEEILNASDQELNRWVSLKRIVSRRPEHMELYDVKAYKKKAANFNKKRKCFPSLYEPKVDHEEQDVIIKNNQDSTEHENNNSEYVNSNELDNSKVSFSNTLEEKKKKKKKKKKIEVNENNIEDFNNRNVIEMKVNPETRQKPEITKKKKEEWKVESYEVNNGTEYGKTLENKKPFKNDFGNDSVCCKRRKRRKRKSKDQGIEEISNLKGEFMNSEVFFNQNSRGNSKKRKFNLVGESGKDTQISNKDSKIHKKRKFIGKFQRENENTCNISDERLRSYGINPKKYKNKLKYKNKNK